MRVANRKVVSVKNALGCARWRTIDAVRLTHPTNLERT